MTERQKDREAERQDGEKTKRQNDRKTKRLKNKKTKRQKHKNTKRQKHKKTKRQKKENIFFEMRTGVITSYSSKTDVSLAFFLCCLSTVPDMSTHSLTMRQ